MDSYNEWNTVRLTGRGGKKKLRRDLTLAQRLDGTLTFTYGNKSFSELLVTLAENDVYTVHWPEKNVYRQTHNSLFHLIMDLAVFSDAARFKHYKQPARIAEGSNRYENVDGKWVKLASMPLTDGLQFQYGACLNPKIAVDYKRTLNRTKSLPWLRKTETLAKLLRVATRMGILERIRNHNITFDEVNLDDTTAIDAEIILGKGNANSTWKLKQGNASLEEKQEILRRCAENGLVDFREWLYQKHGCYEMLPVETKGEAQ